MKMPFPAIWIQLEIVILSEINQKVGKSWAPAVGVTWACPHACPHTQKKPEAVQSPCESECKGKTGPYVVASYLRVLVRPGAVPQAYLTASVWLTFAQAGINPVVCFLFNRELRDCFRAQFPCCQSPQATQATLPCDLKGIGL